MPMQKGTSKLAGLIQAHKNDETVVKQEFTNLPGGITSAEGRARLKQAYRAQYKEGDNKGGDYIRLSATVHAPEMGTYTTYAWQPEPKPKGSVKVVNAVEKKIKGLQTSVMLPLCATGKGDRAKPAEDNVAAALNMLRCIGGEDCLDGVEDEADLDAFLESLVESAPFITFSTRDSKPSKEYPEQRTWEQWHEAATDYEEDDSDDGVDDGTGGKPAKPSKPAKPAEDEESEAEAEPEAEEAAEESGDDLDELVAAADSDDDEDAAREAAAELTRRAEAAGLKKKEIEGADNWEAVAAMIRANATVEEQHPESEGDGDDGDGDDAEVAADEPTDPEKGQLYKVKLIDPKTKKPFKKASQVEVLSVNAKARTVTLKNSDTGKPIIDAKTKKPQAFSFDDLLPDD